MLVVLLSWSIIFYILFSAGDILIFLYNKICRTKERYGFLDTFILGICFVSAILSLTSIWLPSNHYILFTFGIITITYWLIQRNRLRSYIITFTNMVKNLKPIHKILFPIVFIAILIYILFPSGFFDSILYHQQNIRWNEEYSAVPGLGNLEDRFGFNSNYLLLSAIFSFRFIFGEAVYTVQSLLYALILCWIIIFNISASKGSLKFLILLILFLCIVPIDGYMLSDTSTDIIPFLCLFYYIARTSLNPGWINEKPLLAFILPITLITYKLSSAIFCIVCLIILLGLIKQHKNRIITFLLSASFLVISFWCIRNVIITGYLVYPVYQIDLFNFDWKMPQTALILQKIHIYEWAKYIFDIETIGMVFDVGLRGNIVIFGGLCINLLIFATVLISPAFILYCLFRKKSINKNLYFIYGISVSCIIFGLISAPDFRFMNGYIFGCAFLLICISLSVINKPNVLFTNAGKIITPILILGLLFFCIWIKQQNILSAYKADRLKGLMFLPANLKEDTFDEYKMGNTTIYLTKNPYAATYDKLPSTNPQGLPFYPYTGNKMQNIETIELRGKTLQDGFRTKEEYINILKENSGKYIEQYLIEHRKKYPEGYFNNK